MTPCKCGGEPQTVKTRKRGGRTAYAVKLAQAQRGTRPRVGADEREEVRMSLKAAQRLGDVFVPESLEGE